MYYTGIALHITTAGEDLDDLSVDDLSVDDLYVDHLSVDDLSVYDISVDDIPVVRVECLGPPRRDS